MCSRCVVGGLSLGARTSSVVHTLIRQSDSVKQSIGQLGLCTRSDSDPQNRL